MGERLIKATLGVLMKPFCPCLSFLTLLTFVACATTSESLSEELAKVKVIKTVLSTNQHEDQAELKKKTPPIPPGWTSYKVYDDQGVIQYDYMVPARDPKNSDALDLLKKWSPSEAEMFLGPPGSRSPAVLEVFNHWYHSDQVRINTEKLILELNPDFDPVYWQVTWIHEAYHHYINHTRKQPALVFLDFKNPITLPWYNTPAALESAVLLPPDLKNQQTSRIKIYIDPPEGRASRHVCQVHGLYGLLNEYTAYYHSARTTSDFLHFYLDSQNFDFQGVKRLYTSAQNEITAQTEFRLFLLNYLLFIKMNEKELYRALQILEPFKNCLREMGPRSTQVVAQIRSRVQEIQDIYEEPRLREEWEQKEAFFGPYRNWVDREINRSELKEIREEWGL